MKQLIRHIALFFFLSLPLVASAQAGPDDEKAALERWRQMSPEQKQELRERYERWKSLAPDEKSQLRKKLETWQKLQPQ
ncbi:MAG: DUF3106 domain-containing protein, partial [Deltaproteobacteria bacterium]|nr:DUF3106 domain-containing protein [Deltaproteobacteria bacterium]